MDADDGVFWMDMDDFFAEFNRFSVVRLLGHKMSLFDSRWHSFHFSGEWDEWSDGGCMNTDAWVKNPQYHLQVLDEKHPTVVFVHVSQPDRRFFLASEYTKAIGCYVLKVDHFAGRLVDRSHIVKAETYAATDKNRSMAAMLHSGASDGTAPTFINKRDTCLRLELGGGSYIVMPCTFEPNVQMHYSLGLFAESRVKFEEILSEKMVGITAEFTETSAGGPPEVGELARSEKHGDTNASFLANPKIVLHYASARRIHDTFEISLRIEARDIQTPFGVRIYKKTKPHQRSPLREKNLLEDIAPAGNTMLTKKLILEKRLGPFCFVPYTSTKGSQGKLSVSVQSLQPGLSLEQYY